MTEQNEGLGAVIEAYLARFYANCSNIDAEDGMYARIVGEAEKRLLSATLNAVGGNRLRAARILGINRNTLLKKLRAYRLDDNEPALKPAAKRKRR